MTPRLWVLQHEDLRVHLVQVQAFDWLLLTTSEDFGEVELQFAVDSFHDRNRRVGRLGQSAPHVIRFRAAEQQGTVIVKFQADQPE